jgi:glutamyl-tRNA reductase
MAIINLRVTYKKASIPILEAVRLKRYSIASIAQETVIIQTCNRVEIYAVAKDEEKERIEHALVKVWKRRINNRVFTNIGKNFDDFLEVDYGSDAVRHLFRLAAGLESMIVGEDQILGQVKNSLVEAGLAKSVGPTLSLVFDRAVKIGAKIRTENKINKGSVSIGSVAVKLAEKRLGRLEDKQSLLIGAGEVGLLVAKSLIAKGQKNMYVASRTLDRAEALTKIAGGHPIIFEDALKKLEEVDLVVLATSATYNILTRERVERAFKARNKFMLILDLSTPRNVEESVKKLPHVELLTIDSLRSEIDRNLKARMREVKNVEEKIERELIRAQAMLRRESAEPMVASVYKRAETVRVREVSKAIERLGNIDPKVKGVINDMSLAMVNGLLSEPVVNLRKAAEHDDVETIRITKKLFKIQ